MTTPKTAADVARGIVGVCRQTETYGDYGDEIRFVENDFTVDEKVQAIIQQFLTEQLQAQHEETWHECLCAIRREMSDAIPVTKSIGNIYDRDKVVMAKSAAAYVLSLCAQLPCPPINESKE